MTLQEYLDLRNGLDVRGVASEGADNQPITLTAATVNNIAKAFCVWLISRTGKTKVCVAVGYDSRESSPALCEAVVEGIVSTGHDAIVVGLSSTPSMASFLKDEDWNEDNPCHGAIMITAGHLPSNYNGLKFFFSNGAVEDSDVIEMLEMAVDYRFAEPGERGVIQEREYLNEYAGKFTDKIRKVTEEVLPLGGRRILVNTNNEEGSFFAYKVLVPLGADITGSDSFTASEAPAESVVACDADLGIIFGETEGSLAIIEKDGNVINGNRLIALLSAILLEEKAGTIVTGALASDEVLKFIEAKGGKACRFKCGLENAIAEARRLNDQGEYAPLAMGKCGCAALLENDFANDSVYVAVRILSEFCKALKAEKSLSYLIADLQEPVESTSIELAFKEDVDYKTVGAELLQDLAIYAEDTVYTTLTPNNYEGRRIAYDDKHGCGWALVRTNAEAPVLYVNIECAKSGGTLKIAKDLYYFLRTADCFDLTPLETVINNARQALIDGLHNRLMENPEFLDYLFPRAARGVKFVNGHVPTEEEKAAMEAEATEATETAEVAEEQLAMPLEESAPVEAAEVAETVEVAAPVESATVAEAVEATPVSNESEQIEIPVLPTEESAE